MLSGQKGGLKHHHHGFHRLAVANLRTRINGSRPSGRFGNAGLVHFFLDLE